MKFTEFNFSAEVLEGLEAMRFDDATPVQEATIPAIMRGKDLIACAQTGTGKTAAYLLPILNRQAVNQTQGLNTLVLVPTRELAMQIDQQMEGFGYFLNVTSIAVYGGNDAGLWNRQKNALTTGANIIVATPGRLIQHLSMGYVKMDTLEHLILDEADRMLDMGFYEDIMQIVSYLPKKRQTLMFSATMPPKIRKLARELLSDYEEVNISLSKPAEGILQAAYVVYENQKIPLVNNLLKGKDLKSILIFSSTKQKVKDIQRSLKQNGLNAHAIHSDLDQKERTEVMRQFRNRNIQILVATDIIARGIDVEGIDLVINFDVPNDAEDYVHRVGRTARASSTGVALTFITDRDQRDFRNIEELIESTIIKMPPPEEIGQGPEYNPDKKGGKSYQKRNFRKKGKRH
ncbi:MAG: ATP-dependent helicase RhlE [Anaerophaga sp.]|uniref:DEAD/DEAH box helicase n=1 Tax=Anaerophaga thermohalophila TaxID=177400 RepID=UPI000237CC92|nr:DEAD/DEAH box helicase [Anaerophaga thermohalophila]MDI3521408.1 ATP-dependent helicase RhlE [Anaerophaga sp.]MDN5292675.1 ATP-dependent helicase RhlE [Anaerophaga sp.]